MYFFLQCIFDYIDGLNIVWPRGELEPATVVCHLAWEESNIDLFKMYLFKIQKWEEWEKIVD